MQINEKQVTREDNLAFAITGATDYEDMAFDIDIKSKDLHGNNFF